MRLWGVALLLSFAGPAQVEYRGKLDRELVVPAVSHQVSDFHLASADQRLLLGAEARPGDRVFAGTVRGLTAFVVEGDGETVLYVDLNNDGRITVVERQSLSPSPDRLHAGIANVLLPLPGPVYKHYPVRVYVYRPQKPDSRIVGESPRAFVQGSVTIGGRSTLVEYEFDRAKNCAFPDHGWQGMDSDGDGKIDTHAQSPEYAYARDELVVFRVGDEYVSTKTLDLAKRTVMLRSHGSGDYRRIELKPGVIFPDFSFTDFSGRIRKLSDFGARYVLLDFWATWCGPCVADLPHLGEARRQLKDRGFEAIGMNVDEDPSRVRKMLDDKRVDWPQATFESIRELVEKRIRVNAYPTYVLLDPERRIISTGDDLRGAKLLPTLQKLLDAGSSATDEKKK